MRDKISKLPFHILQKNKSVKPWDDYIKENINGGKSYEDLIEGNIYLSELKLSDAWKEISKTAYSLGYEPDSKAQGYESKSVMGAAGEALTELLLPGYDVPANNKGYDINYRDHYVEVKSTVSARVKMSNAQYQQADYLMVHVFIKKHGSYDSSYLIPLRILKAYKPGRKNSVTVNFNIDIWARNLVITPERIVAFFEMITDPSALEKNIACVSCRTEPIASDLKKLVEKTTRCDCLYWEQHYASYEREFLAPRAKQSQCNLTLNDRDKKDLEEHKRKGWFFSCTQNSEGYAKLLRSFPAATIVGPDYISIHFCPTYYSVRKLPSCVNYLNFDFYELYAMMQSYNQRQDMPVRDFYILCSQDRLVISVRSGMAAMKGDGLEKVFEIDCLAGSSFEIQIVRWVRRLQAACAPKVVM